ncbi:hypothetical protein BFF78_24280 [Streptomyces fodineus]|uniref:Uncharacterized protein n=1 Tax=Streptomyces fodineus TaxID=1904616 RepID=A0A1D7YDY3_9ACTN|nr:hypothetical protein [Streptomyces fodineus]AOR33762.1 hypothetical protein BFF78_24280 [Streptomyces fodineus]
MFPHTRWGAAPAGTEADRALRDALAVLYREGAASGTPVAAARTASGPAPHQLALFQQLTVRMGEPATAQPNLLPALVMKEGSR